MAKVTTGPLRGSAKSDREKVTRVTRRLRSSGKSDNRAATRQWQEWQGRGAAVGEVMEVKEAGDSSDTVQ